MIAIAVIVIVGILNNSGRIHFQRFCGEAYLLYEREDHLLKERGCYMVPQDSKYVYDKYLISK